MAVDKGKMLNNGRFLTPVFRINYPKVCTRIPEDAEYDPGRFTVQAVWNDNDDLQKAKQRTADLSLLEKMVDECAKKAGHKKGWRSPLNDGDEKGYSDESTVANLKAYKMKPTVVWADKSPIEDDDDITPGCFARAIISCFAYDQKGNKGVTLTLDSIQILGGGKRYVGGAAAAAAKQADEEFDQEDFGDTEEADEEDDEI